MSFLLVINAPYKLKNGISVGDNSVWHLTSADLKEDKVRLEPANKNGLPMVWESPINTFYDYFEPTY